jgi:ceramide kinase
VYILCTYHIQFYAGCKYLIDLCSTTGERDPVTSALLIILGRRISLDIAQVVRWKSSPSAEILPTVRYAASFAGYVTSSRT